MKNEKIIQKSEFIKSYAGLKRGEENAIAFLNKIIAEIGLQDKSAYSKQEAINICTALTSKGGAVKIIALTVKARLMLRI